MSTPAPVPTPADSAAPAARGADAASTAQGTSAASSSTPAADLASLLRRHWRKTRLLTAALLLVWLALILGLGLFARELARISFFGWPLSFYMGAQGALIIFLLIIGCHCVAMNRLDRGVQQASQGKPGQPAKPAEPR